MCLDGYSRCISTCGLLYPATVESIFERSFCTVPLPPSSLSLSLSLSHARALAHALKSKSPQSLVPSQPSTYLLATILSKIINHLRPLPLNLYRDYGSHDPTSIARHNQRSSECSRTTYQQQSSCKGEGEEDAQQGRLSADGG